MNFEELTKLIRTRETSYANNFLKKEVTKEIIKKIVSNALWAPTHKLTEPWQFIVLDKKTNTLFDNYAADYYRKMYDKEQFSDEFYENTKVYSENATLIAIILKPSKRIKLPEWEEIAAISCAVQNMWLSCTSMNIGCYWDTGKATLAFLNSHLKLNEIEKCLGVFYIGYLKNNLPKKNRKRKPLSKKLIWE